MSSKQKKVILRSFLGTILHGYLPASGFVQKDEVIYLNLDGRVATIPIAEVKTICYVRDFNLSDLSNPERLQRRCFLARPRGEGLWVRITFKEDDDVLEGLTAADMLLLDSLAEDAGVYLLPPDTRTNTQRIYIPRSAIAAFQVLSVISSPSKRKSASLLTQEGALEAPQLPIQDALFEGAPQQQPRRGKHERSR